MTWDYLWNASKKKWDKPPRSAHTGRPASINEPANLGTFPEAVATAARLGMAGVGFLLMPDDRMTGFDLDHCVTDAGTFSEMVAEVIGFAETYAEFSPSGKGIRGFALGKVDKALKDDASASKSTVPAAISPSRAARSRARRARSGRPPKLWVGSQPSLRLRGARSAPRRTTSRTSAGTSGATSTPPRLPILTPGYPTCTPPLVSMPLAHGGSRPRTLGAI